MQLARRTLVVLFVMLATVIATTVVACAASFAPPDSNRYVPEYYQTVGTCYDGILGKDHYYYAPRASYGPHVHWIEYDVCEMRRLGATAAGWERLKAHERAHSEGKAHYEGTPATNAAYYPTTRVR